MFGGDDPPTPIATVLEWLIKPYALHGGVDMFIYIQVDLKFSGANLTRKSHIFTACISIMLHSFN